ncbi:MAG: glycosyltransferase family 2 protein [Thermoleophilia bacterium]
MENNNERTGGVGCVIVNYRSPLRMLEQCLDSIITGNADTPCTVVLVDNASGDGVFEEVAAKYPAVATIQMGSNAGFAAAVNRGLATLDEPYVLMLNTDALLAPGALAAMTAALEAAPDDCAGIAPKMMLSSHANIIDAVGTVMPTDGASFNRGIGQCDLGQFDEEDDVFGVCFGAALLRRSLFAADAVGPLHEDYFLYFEDSDWCLRARAQGYVFRTAPQASVLHLHSGVARNESLSFKYKLIELNTMKLVLRNFESATLAVKVVAARSARLLARAILRRSFIRENLSTLGSLLVSLPGLLKERRQLASRRNTSDQRTFALAAGEDAYFDTVAYKPQRPIESLLATYTRLQQAGGPPDADAVLRILRRLRQEEVATGLPQVTDADKEFLARQPECVLRLLGKNPARPASTEDKD